MTYFDKMVKDMRNKDLDAIQDWLHPDFLFVADFEMLTREDWLEETKKEFNRNDVTLLDNAKCTLENERRVVFEQTTPESNGVICCSWSWWLDGFSPKK